MPRRLSLAVIVFAFVASGAAPQVRFTQCSAAGFDPALARAVFEAQAPQVGEALEVRCLAGGVAQVRRGGAQQEVRLDGLSPTVKATTLGMVLIEVARAPRDAADGSDTTRTASAPVAPAPRPAADKGPSRGGLAEVRAPALPRSSAPLRSDALRTDPATSPAGAGLGSTPPLDVAVAPRRTPGSRVAEVDAPAPGAGGGAPGPRVAPRTESDSRPAEVTGAEPEVAPASSGLAAPASSTGGGVDVAVPGDKAGVGTGTPAPAEGSAPSPEVLTVGAPSELAVEGAVVTRAEGSGHASGTTFVPADAALLPSVSVNAALGHERARNLFSLGLLAARGEHLDGLALSVGASFFDGAVDGVQAAAGFASAGRVRGLQLGGGAAWSEHGVWGAQAGLAALTPGETRGLQLGGGLAWTGGEVWGAQAALVTKAGDVRGLQLGLLNVGGDVDGAQVGLVNVAGRVRGLQLGLVNVARSSAAPLGLVSLVDDGGFRAALFAGVSSMANLTLSLGGEHVYSLLALGWNPWQAGQGVPCGPGLGYRSSNGPGWSTAVEGSFQYLWTFRGPWTSDWGTTLRVRQTYRFASRFAVFAGLQVEVYRRLHAAPEAPTPLPWVLHDSNAVRVTLAPGAVVGVEL